MSKVRGPKGQTPDCPVLLKNFVETLFPTQHMLRKRKPFLPKELDPTAIPIVSDVDLINATARFGNSKAPERDLIPNRVLKMTLQQNLQCFKKTYTNCLRDGIFPKIWKNDIWSDCRSQTKKLGILQLKVLCGCMVPENMAQTSLPM